MSYRRWDYLFGAAAFTAILFMVSLMFLPFWLLWNWIMPLFGLPTLTILQSIGLYLLLKLVIFTPNIKE